MSAKFLILPIETKARELLGKALLGAVAAEAGFEVLLGDQREIARSIHRLPRGIYLDKSVSRTKTLHYRRLKDLGHRVAAWCEEGLVYRDKAAYQFERISQASIEQVDAFFAWGDVHGADVSEAVPAARDKVHIVGNPRFDLLRPPYSAVLDKDARRLSAEYGKFILVVTTFSRFNRHKGQRGVLDVLQARGFDITADQQQFYDRLVEHLRQVFEAFQAMMPVLARSFPGHTIIIRPHPSEDHDRWREAVADLPNVKVVYQGSVEPWLSACDAVIHNASTIGVEAFLLDRPVFSYIPVIDEVFNRPAHLPNVISTNVHSVDDLIAGVRAALDGQALPPLADAARMELVRRYVANTSGPLASQRIVRILSHLHDGGDAKPNTLRYLNAWSRSAARKSLSQVRHLLRPNRGLKDYMDQKFPGLASEEIEDQLASFSQATGHGDRFVVVPHPELHNCYTISPQASLA